MRLSKARMKRLALAGALSTGAGGTATSVMPGLAHWPPSAVAAAVLVVVATAGALRRAVTTAAVAVVATLALVAVDAAVGGRLHTLLDIGVGLS